MKKLLSLLTILIVAITSSWAADDPTLAIGTTAQTTSTFLGVYSTEGITLSSSASYSSGAVQLGNTPSSYDDHYFEVLSSKGQIEKVSFLISGNGSNKSIQAPVFGWATTASSNTADTYRILDAVTVTANSYAAAQWFDYDLSTSDVKCIRIYRTTKYISSEDPAYTGSSTALGSGQTIKIYGIKVWLKAQGPTITTQPEGASYVSGATMDALTVEATASAGTLTYQWYSCDDADKTNPEAIDGATSASYTPSAAGYYYVKITDSNGSVDSDVAQITVSAAEAPTISVSGTPAEAVKVGTEVTLTATATGVPTPTITWYNGSDEAVATVEGTELAYTVPTTTAGTYTFYAKASNGVGDDATSAVQTVVVKEQVATPTFTPNGAFFEGSQEVAIASATDGATIQYSTDNGESWNNYTAAFTVTATTTVKAKATKDGYIDSESATATFTKVTLDDQVDVTGAATWDWSKFGTKEIKLTDQTTPSKTTEFVLSNAVNYGLCASIGSEFGNAQQLKVTTEYVVRDTKFFQGASIKFNTTVPGKITVVYSNTGNRTDEALRRFLNVNGINYGVGAMRSDATTTTTVSVAAGEVAITGKFGPSVEDQTDQYLRINSITFTPTTTETVTIPTEGVATYVTKSALDFSTVNGTIKAYAVTGVSETSATTAEVGAVPAGTPLLIKGAEGDYDIEIVESASPVNNLLKISTGTVTGEAGNVYAYSKSALKFKKVAETVKVPAGKCYLQIDGNGGEALDIIFEGEATAVDAIAEADEAEAAPVKVIKNGKLYIGNFNVAGQQVK